MRLLFSGVNAEVKRRLFGERMPCNPLNNHALNLNRICPLVRNVGERSLRQLTGVSLTISGTRDGESVCSLLMSITANAVATSLATLVDEARQMTMRFNRFKPRPTTDNRSTLVIGRRQPVAPLRSSCLDSEVAFFLRRSLATYFLTHRTTES